ncbi:hypothetical protein [Gordonia sp. ABSL49_1]|uniref:YveK family protein n=1 Tax=Gordonia sp. ABSL49_1 TaxID=2920941 RepID=UPI001F0E7AC9|nr:hypothetical protein [Gordonia sp. ABSL49_1]MCH5645477.1 hypothetical protein [Gordonia sp. ABSL49_1]
MRLNAVGAFLRFNGVVIVAMTLIGLGIGVVIGHFSSTRYSASATVMTSISQTKVDAGGYKAVAYLMSRVPEYARIADSESFLRYAIQANGLSIAEGDLSDAMVVTSPKDSGLLVISVTSSTPQSAIAQVNSLARSLTKVIPEREDLIPVRATVVDEAALTSVTSDSMGLSENLMYGVAGATLGLSIAVLRVVARSRRIEWHRTQEGVAA